MATLTVLLSHQMDHSVLEGKRSVLACQVCKSYRDTMAYLCMSGGGGGGWGGGVW